MFEAFQFEFMRNALMAGLLTLLGTEWWLRRRDGLL
jgi:hypothetical protein